MDLLYLSEAEAQILDAILSLELFPYANQGETDENIKEGDQLFPTEENLRKREKLIQVTAYNEQHSKFDWTKGFETLHKKDMIQMDGSVYQLTESGSYYANLVRSKRIGETFSDVLIRSDKSRAYAEFCERYLG
jgi:hypothetical protein